MKDILDDIAARVRPLAAEGRVAQYIPALARVDPNKFAIAVVITPLLYVVHGLVDLYLGRDVAHALADEAHRRD